VDRVEALEHSEGPSQHGADADLVDLPHRVDRTTGDSQHLPFLPIEITGADQHHILGPDFAPRPADVDQLPGTVAEQGCQGHAVDILARRTGRGIEVAVGVNPQQTDLPVVGDTADRTDGDRVIAAEEDRDLAPVDRLPGHGIGSFGDLRGSAPGAPPGWCRPG